MGSKEQHPIYVRLLSTGITEGTSPTDIDLSIFMCSCSIGKPHAETDAQYRKRYRKYLKEQEAKNKIWRNTRCEVCGRLNRNCICEPETIEDYCECCCHD